MDENDTIVPEVDKEIVKCHTLPFEYTDLLNTSDTQVTSVPTFWYLIAVVPGLSPVRNNPIRRQTDTRITPGRGLS